MRKKIKYIQLAAIVTLLTIRFESCIPININIRKWANPRDTIISYILVSLILIYILINALG